MRAYEMRRFEVRRMRTAGNLTQRHKGTVLRH